MADASNTIWCEKALDGPESGIRPQILSMETLSTCLVKDPMSRPQILAYLGLKTMVSF